MHAPYCQLPSHADTFAVDAERIAPPDKMTAAHDSATDCILETRDLVKEFKDFVAVNGVDLRIRRGHIHALIGPNGAGKTTCFNLLTKFLEPTSGRILFNGHDITDDKPAHIARRGIVRSFQISAVFPHLTVLENVRLALQGRLGTAFHFWRSKRSLDTLNERAMELLGYVDLASFADLITVEMPYGRKRALEIATTLALEPELMLLDEPTQGMGHEDVDRVMQLIKKVSQGRTILMVEHNMKVVAGISDAITVLARGSVLAEGSYTEVAKDPQVIEAYMGKRTRGSAGSAGMNAKKAGTESLRVSDLHAFYGESHILHGVSFTVNRGECVSLLGRNGAGRTTTLRAILGLTGRRSGSVMLNGREIIGWTHKIAHLGVGYCPEERGIYASLSCEENLRLPPVVANGGMSMDEIYAMFPNLEERRASQGTRLSGGEQQMLAMARILRTGARVLLLDEISEGLAPVTVEKLGQIIRRLKDQGFTIVLVEQNFRFAAPLADRM